MQLMQWWQVLMPDPNEEQGEVRAVAVFHGIVCVGWGGFRVNLSCSGGFSGSTWRVFWVNLTCYETHEI